MTFILGCIPGLNYIAFLACLIPSLAIGARRLHDIGKSGWMMLVALIPCVGGLILLFWCIQPTLTVGNSFAAAAPADQK